MSEEAAVRGALCKAGATLAARGLSPGTTGNLSQKLDDGRFIVTPTNASLGDLSPERLSLLSPEGDHVAGDPPTKEAFLHLAMYGERPDARAIVHLHSTYSVAVSCLAGIDPADALPPLTAYFVMRIGRLPLVAYHPPGDTSLADAVALLARDHHAVLLANHGPVVAGTSLQAAVSAAEELEETARLFLLLRGENVRLLDAEQVSELRRRFG